VLLYHDCEVAMSAFVAGDYNKKEMNRSFGQNYICFLYLNFFDTFQILSRYRQHRNSVQSVAMFASV